MQALLTIVVALAAAFAGRWAVTRSTGADTAPQEVPGELLALRAQLAELRSANEAVARTLAARGDTLAAAAAPVSESGEAEIAAALQRWRAAHPAEVQRSAEERAKPEPSAAELDFAKVSIGELVRELSRTGLGDRERQELFQRLRDSGRIDEYVAKIEELAAANPNDPVLQVALGNAYLQKLFGVSSGPEMGTWAYKSDGAFNRALELDDHNWDARFVKAVSLSNWPAFLGRGPEAIANFEELLDQQSEVRPRDEFAMTYLFLGNLHQANGDTEKALAVWREGLAKFPLVEELRNAIAAASGGR